MNSFAVITGSRTRHVPTDVLGLLDTDDPHRAVLYPDGRIAALAASLLDQLGFDESDDLAELHFASFWDHRERAKVRTALARTREGTPVTLDLGLEYVTGVPAKVDVTLEPLDPMGLVLVTLACP